MYERDFERLDRWYRASVRPFLDRMGNQRLDELDRELKRIQSRVEGLCKPLAACFIGGSGVGKSTLINSLVGRDRVIVPSGGVGPLTAQAIKIEFDVEPSLQAIYHPPKAIWRLIFAIDRSLDRELDQGAGAAQSDLRDGLDEETRLDAEDPDDSGDTHKQSKTHQLLKQAQLLVTGQQEGSPEKPYLIDCLREAIGKDRKWGTILRDADEVRVARLKRVFATDELEVESCFTQSGHAESFSLELRNHASGFLAPALKSLNLSWPSELLQRGLDLVDLPGLGIAGDLYRNVTDDWMRHDANVVILVVDNRGIRDSDVDLLRASGFLNRLLHSADDPSADPVSFVVTVVKADEIAEERRAIDKGKSKREHLHEVMRECREKFRDQVEELLHEAWSLGRKSAAGEFEISETKRDILQRLVSELAIFPVSAVQYRRLMADDEDDLPFIKTDDESGIPQLSNGLAQMADKHRQECFARFRDSLLLYQERLITALGLIRAQWEQSDRAKDEADALERQLEEFLRPRLKEFAVRQGQFRSFLKETVPEKIETLIAESRQSAGKAIRTYLRSLEGAHWSTLRAAVRRGGTYMGSKHIDLPRDFAQTFEEPVAEAWSKKILREIRTATKGFADVCIESVQEVIAWARQQGNRVQPRLIEAQQESIRADAKQLESVGRELINKLRDKVRHDLVSAIETPIRRKCQEFVKKNADVGTGVKRRILELFDELADDALEAAVAPCRKVLQENYRMVEAEIREAFKNHQNPLESAKSALVSSHEDYVKRSDAQKRGRILQELEAVVGESPELFQISELQIA